MKMATVDDEYQRAWDELGAAIERNQRLIERNQAIEDEEQARYLRQWREERETETYGWEVYVMAAFAMAILWGAALWPWIAALWLWVAGAL